METERKHESRAGKREYSEPSLTEVLLKPEEAVLGNCKINGTSGPLQSSCDTPAVCYTTTS